LFEDFLCQELLEGKPIQKATLIMEAVEKRKLEVLYKSSMKRANQLTSNEVNVSAQLHYHRFQTEKLFYELTDLDIRRQEKSNLGEIINSLDHFYLAEKLKYYCTSLSRKAFADHKYDFLFIKEILDHIKNHQYADVPIVNIWISIYFLQTGTADEKNIYFNLFKSTFRQIVSSLDLREAAGIFTYGQNHCIWAINQGQDSYFQEISSMKVSD